MKKSLIVALVCLLLSSNVFALTISTNTHGVYSQHYPPIPGVDMPYPYFYDDSKSANTGFISSYVNQDSPTTNPLSLPISPDTTYLKGYASASASSSGFLSVVAQSQQLNPTSNHISFSAEASWQDTITNDDFFTKNYILNMDISPINLFISWGAGDGLGIHISYEVDVLLNGNVIWETQNALSQDTNPDYIGLSPGSKSLFIPPSNVSLFLGQYACDSSFDLQYIVKLHSGIYDHFGNFGLAGPVAVMGNITTSPVPEPSTMLLLGSGLLGLVGFMKKKNSDVI